MMRCHTAELRRFLLCAATSSLCLLIPGCKGLRVDYASPGPIYVSYIDNQTSEFGNLTVPLHLAVKQRLARVGIEVVDEKGQAFALNIRLYPREARPESFSKVVVICEVDLQDKGGRVVDGPDAFEMEPLFNEQTTTTTVELNARRDQFIDKAAKMIVRRFFRQGEKTVMLRVVE